ncbi:hypothetical protein GOP47_0017505 [Adiantum capillus-veneris]|uniref:Uncharacterized protein n=1 Tax=Adiantum capillus-veneris TaxID=13818 RepID=A0A9D4UFX6_ADICA|nr:hypothetical protein GOP47_0017505 [Adiantum capillus-veneris]
MKESNAHWESLGAQRQCASPDQSGPILHCLRVEDPQDLKKQDPKFKDNPNLKNGSSKRREKSVPMPKVAMLVIFSSWTWGKQRVKALQNPSDVLQDFARRAAFWRQFKLWRLVRGKVSASAGMISSASYRDASDRKIWLQPVKSTPSLQEEDLT